MAHIPETLGKDLVSRPYVRTRWTPAIKAKGGEPTQMSYVQQDSFVVSENVPKAKSGQPSPLPEVLVISSMRAPGLTIKVFTSLATNTGQRLFAMEVISTLDKVQDER